MGLAVSGHRVDNLDSSLQQPVVGDRCHYSSEAGCTQLRNSNLQRTLVGRIPVQSRLKGHVKPLGELVRTILAILIMKCLHADRRQEQPAGKSICLPFRISVGLMARLRTIKGNLRS